MRLAREIYISKLLNRKAGPDMDNLIVTNQDEFDNSDFLIVDESLRQAVE